VSVAADAPSVVAQVAQRYEQTTRGVVEFRLHRVFDVHGGLRSRHEDLVLNGVYSEGAIVRVRVVSYAIDGKPASSQDVSRVEQSWNNPKPGDVFAPPYDPRFLDAYQYQAGAGSTIDFTSEVPDGAHGRGTLTYDASNDVVSISYQPNALPPHASSGQITDLRTEVLPGYWATTHETQEYKGNYGPFAAAGTVQSDFSGFRRFDDLPAALRAL
jgi:hypothetical protein